MNTKRVIRPASLIFPISRPLAVAVVAIHLAVTPIANGADGKANKADKEKTTPASAQLENVLDLVAKGRAAAELSAEGAYRLNVRLTNKTAEPIRAEFPPGLVADAFAQNGILAQVRQGGGGGAQGLGFLQSKSIDVAAGATATVSFATACLNFGVPEPNKKTLLFLKSARDYSADPRVGRVLANIARQGIETNVAQAALWNVANDLGWDRLAGQGTLPRNRFTAMQLTAAQQFVATAAPSPGSSTTVERNEADRDAPVTAAALSIALNPDPRGSAASVALVLESAQELRERFLLTDVGHRNFVARPRVPQAAAVQWSALVQTRSATGGRQERPVIIALQRSTWDPAKQSWRHDKPATCRFVPDAAGPTAGWLADRLIQEIAERSIEIKWSKAGDARSLVVVNALPCPIRSLTVIDKRNTAARVILSPKAATASRAGLEFALTPEQTDKLGAASRVFALAFEPGE